MTLTPALEKAYTHEPLTAEQAQAKAELIAWGPAVFQASRLMLRFGILEHLSQAERGLTRQELTELTGLSDYALKCLLEAALCIGTVLVDTATERFTLSKTGWFMLNDPATRVNIDFNHDVNYVGWHSLGQALAEGRPAGLAHFGPWATVYEALSSLPAPVRESWLAFDHFYSDAAFSEALPTVFGEYRVRRLYDVGGNTGQWALLCVAHSPDVEVVVLDLPQQITMMQANIAGKPGAERIEGYAINILDTDARFPQHGGCPDAIWMSQFLDCFSPEQIVSILQRASQAMDATTRLFIMEPLWDRQRFTTAAFCLTMTSLYFTAIANGNSKMYATQDLTQCVERAGLTVERIIDGLGQGHSIMVCKRKQ